MAQNYFAKAMLLLAMGSSDQAADSLKTASSKSPRTHGLNLFVANLKNDLEGEAEIWERAARIFQKPGIDDRYQMLISRLKAEPIKD
jgi:hypothetical protein